MIHDWENMKGSFDTTVLIDDSMKCDMCESFGGNWVEFLGETCDLEPLIFGMGSHLRQKQP